MCFTVAITVEDENDSKSFFFFGWRITNFGLPTADKLMYRGFTVKSLHNLLLNSVSTAHLLTECDFTTRDIWSVGL